MAKEVTTKIPDDVKAVADDLTSGFLPITDTQTHELIETHKGRMVLLCSILSTATGASSTVCTNALALLKKSRRGPITQPWVAQLGTLVKEVSELKSENLILDEAEQANSYLGAANLVANAAKAGCPQP